MFIIPREFPYVNRILQKNTVLPAICIHAQIKGDVFMNNSQITSRIKLLCKEKNISVAQLLSNCGFAKSFVYDLEKRDNSPSCDRISKIADVLECPVDYLLGRTDAPKPEAEIIKDNHGSAFIGANVTELPLTEKLEFMKKLVEKTKK